MSRDVLILDAGSHIVGVLFERGFGVTPIGYILHEISNLHASSSRSRGMSSHKPPLKIH
jgi:hypothetical protein